MSECDWTVRLCEALCTPVLSVSPHDRNDTLIEVRPDDLRTVIETLRHDPGLRFETLMNHLGAEVPDGYVLIYNLHSRVLGQKATVKTKLPPEAPEADSLEPVFPGIGWFERETYDLLGIRFRGNRNLKRLLLPDDWEGHPLRKDYVFPENYRGIDNREGTDPEGRN